ncbi:MAG: hypothetical protein H0U98_07040 [Alphaproteobacteria bacterium]|nr:hypothetical protein [Alphaproteobacteria bacterium]
MLVSIVVTPLIAYFLFVMGKQGRMPKRSAADSRFRTPGWNYLKSRRQEPPRRAAFTKLHRHGPRAG